MKTILALCLLSAVLAIIILSAITRMHEQRADIYPAEWTECVKRPGGPLLKRDRLENNTVIRSQDRGTA